MWELLYDDMANVLQIPLPPPRPEPRTPSPPPRPDIPRDVSPRPIHQSLRFEMDMQTGQQRNRGAGENQQMDQQRAHELRNTLSSITGIPIPAQAATAVINRGADGMSTPSPPRAPMFPPGRAPQLPPFGHLPPRSDDFFAHSAVFHPAPHGSHHFEPLMPLNGFARPPTHSPFLHAPPPPPIPRPSQTQSYFNRPTNPFAAFAGADPHSGIMPPPPPMSTSRPQVPVEHEDEYIFTRHPPPPRRWNDNDTA